MKVRSALRYFGAVLIVGVIAIALLSNSLITKQDVAAAYLACAAANPGEALQELRQAYSSMGVAFSDKEGGTLVGYERYFGERWLCAVATDSGGHISGAVRL